MRGRPAERQQERSEFNRDLVVGNAPTSKVGNPLIERKNSVVVRATQSPKPQKRRESPQRASVKGNNLGRTITAAVA
jgi:hypothetical protein